MYRPQYAPVDASRCRILVDAPRSHETAHSCDTKLVIPPPGHAAQPPVTLEVQMFEEARGDGSLSAQEGVGLFLLQREALRRNDPPGAFPSAAFEIKQGHQHRFVDPADPRPPASSRSGSRPWPHPLRTL